MASRRPGSDLVLERFPDAHKLWEAIPVHAALSQFVLTAYAIKGRVVILQEFTDHRSGSWDAYVPASNSNEVAATLDAIACP